MIDAALKNPAPFPGVHKLHDAMDAVPEVREIYPAVFDLYQNTKASLFREPVNALELDSLLTYYDTIKEPMSIRDVLERIVKNEYSTAEQVKRDVEQIWRNCEQFNGREFFLLHGAPCREYFAEKLRQIEDLKLITPEQQDAIGDWVQRGDENFSASVMDIVSRLNANALRDGELFLDSVNVKAYRAIMEVFQKRHGGGGGGKRGRDES